MSIRHATLLPEGSWAGKGRILGRIFILTELIGNVVSGVLGRILIYAVVFCPFACINPSSVHRVW